jgi:hypothetical protein
MGNMAADPNKDPSGTPEGEGGKQGGDPGKGGGAPTGGNGDPAGGDNKDGDGGNKPADQYVTPTILQNLLNAEKRRMSEEMKALAKQNESLSGSLEALTKRLEEVGKPGKSEGKEGDKSKDPESSELAELRRQLDQMKETSMQAEARAADERQKRLDQEFRNSVISQLVECGCEKPEEAFLVIKPRLTHDTESSKIFATVESEYGPQDLDLKTFIDRHFKEDILPHVFKGKMRSGGPAGGDNGGQGYQFTREQAFDPVAYAKDPEKHRAAIEAGRVRGMSRPSS